MKGVIYRIAPAVKIVDISHTINSYSVIEGALKLKSAFKYFPLESIHLAIIDPGVGSERKILLARTENYFFVAPDNGLLTFVFDVEPPLSIVSVTNSRFFLPEVSSTFHGRDIFAPVAANLALGRGIEDFGSPVENIQRLPHPYTCKEDSRITGEVIYTDKFGNLITSITKEMLKGRVIKKILYKDCIIEEISRSYTQGMGGQVVAIVNSFENLEISVYKGSARELLKGEIHDRVVVEFF